MVTGHIHTYMHACMYTHTLCTYIIYHTYNGDCTTIGMPVKSPVQAIYLNGIKAEGFDSLTQLGLSVDMGHNGTSQKFMNHWQNGGRPFCK